VERKIIGYRFDGTELYEQKDIGSMAMLYCQGCKKVLAKTGGKKDVYCPSCAKRRGLVSKEE